MTEALLPERLRLLYGAVWSTVVPTYLLCAVMYFALSNDKTQIPLLAWCVTVSLSKTWSAIDARYWLKHLQNEAQTRARRLVLMNAIDGAAW